LVENDRQKIENSLIYNKISFKTTTFEGAYALSSAELYYPSTGLWTVTASINYIRSYHTASVLTNGKILVASGFNGRSYLESSEIYQP
jgi:hypothetical protein